MITYKKGNLLDADVDVLVNAVNTVGVMGKGIALMFKERFPANMDTYHDACKAKQLIPGKMFVTKTNTLIGPRWIVNFPTKKHWKGRSRIEWIEEGLQDLRRFLIEENVRSIAIPALGAGLGGLSWSTVKARIESTLSGLEHIDIWVYEPGHSLTPAGVIIAELVRRYGMFSAECGQVEIQALVWLFNCACRRRQQESVFKVTFKAGVYGPYAGRLRPLIDGLDGTLLKAERPIQESELIDAIWFNNEEKKAVTDYLNNQAKTWLPVLDEVSQLIDGFESTLGLELLVTVDWLVTKEGCMPTLASVKEGLRRWPSGENWATRKTGLFTDNQLEQAICRLADFR